MCADTGFSRSREHIRMIRACRRDVSRTYVKLAIIIVAPKKHKTHGLSELDDVGIENGNDHPGTGGARGDCPARRVIRRADWPARGVPYVTARFRPAGDYVGRNCATRHCFENTKRSRNSFLILHSPRKLFCKFITYFFSKQLLFFLY